MSDSGASQQSDLPVNQSDELFGGDNIGGVQQPNDIGDGNQEDEYTQFIKKGMNRRMSNQARQPTRQR